MTTPALVNNMSYVNLGKSGLKVSKVILGCMSYGTSKWQDWVLDEEESIKHIKAAYDLGINTFDTANYYSNGLSEVALGKAIKQHNIPRDEIVVMTKFFGTVMRDPYQKYKWLTTNEAIAQERYINQQGGSRKHIFDAVKHSLERLQMDYIDVLQMHRLDPTTPIEETMQALHDVVKAGYVRYIGMSSCFAWQFAKMQYYAGQSGLTQFISMQNFHNAVYREEEREMVPLLQDMGIGMIPWSPLARGFLTRPFGASEAETTRFKTDTFNPFRGVSANAEAPAAIVNKRISEIANKKGVSMAQIALAWTLSKPYITAPIVGTTSLEKLKDLCEGVHVELTEEEVKYIDEPYKSMQVIGHW